MEPYNDTKLLTIPRSVDRIKVLHKHIVSGNEAEGKIIPNSTSSAIYAFNAEEVNGIDRKSIALQTKQSSTVTPEQLKQYEDEGYFVVKGLISSSDIKKYTEHFRKICAGEVDKQDMLVMRDVVLAKQNKGKPIKGEEEVTKIQDWQNDETLMEYVRDVNVLKYVEGVIGDNTRSIHTMLINKPPDLGKGTSEHPMHQDLLYFPFRPANRIIAAWTALQEINEENGCLSVMPGTHKLGLFPHHIPNELGNKAYQGVHNDTIALMLQKEGRKMIPLVMQPGDTVFFHPCLIHGSGPNWSKKFRKAISCHYASGLCRFSRIPDHNFGVIEELFESLKHKYSLKEKTLSRDQMLEVYIALWKVKSRQITGVPEKEWEVDLSKVEDLFK